MLVDCVNLSFIIRFNLRYTLTIIYRIYVNFHAELHTGDSAGEELKPCFHSHRYVSQRLINRNP